MVIEGAFVDALADAAPNVSDHVEHRQKLAELDSILGSMDEEQRLVFVLFEVERMTGTEVADSLAIPLGTAYSRLRLARATFRAEVARRRAAERTPLLRVGNKG